MDAGDKSDISSKNILDFICTYYLVKSNKKIEDIDEPVDIFGIQIDKRDSKGIHESSIIKDMGSDYNKVAELLQKLKDGDVTPITLQDIAIDNI